jgi:proline racemase
MKRIPYLDSHTGGEPTRLISSLPFDLGTGSVAEKLSTLKAHHDDLRRTVLLEPRGSDVLVGAYLVPPADPTCQFGVIYFNNVGYLGMCGHGTIGLIASLAYLGKVQPGVIRVETPVGVVEATLHPMSLRGGRQPDEAISSFEEVASPTARNDRYPNRVSVRNIPAYRYLTHIPVTVDGKTIHGDVAYGGNWFFLCHDHGLDVNMSNLEALTDFSWRVREQFTANGITGANGAEIDHVARSRQQKFCALPRQSLRSLSVWHRHQRQTRLFIQRWKVASGTDLETAKRRRQYLRRQCAIGRRQDHSHNHGRSLGHVRRHDFGG